MAFNLNNLKFNDHNETAKKAIVKILTFRAEIFLLIYQLLDIQMFLNIKWRILM